MATHGAAIARGGAGQAAALRDLQRELVDVGQLLEAGLGQGRQRRRPLRAEPREISGYLVAAHCAVIARE